MGNLGSDGQARRPAGVAGNAAAPRLDSGPARREHILLTVLGTNPRCATYALDGRTIATRLAPVALLDFFTRREEKPDRILAVCTPEARRETWPLLEGAAGQDVDVERVDVPNDGLAGGSRGVSPQRREGGRQGRLSHGRRDPRLSGTLSFSHLRCGSVSAGAPWGTDSRGLVRAVESRQAEPVPGPATAAGPAAVGCMHWRFCGKPGTLGRWRGSSSLNEARATRRRRTAPRT